MAVAKLDKNLPVAGKRFLELNKLCPLFPIGSEGELDRAIAAIDRLIDQDELTPEEDAYLAVLSRLVHDYEEEHEPMDDVTPGQMLAFLIEQRGVTQAAVAKAVDISDATVSQILADKRRPGRKLMASLGAYFKVDPAVFL
jgi:HTH-type transcriptional regulator/antitoxin HigA